MQDSRIKQLARNLVNYSCRVQPGENVLIELNGEAPELACALIEEVYRAGGRPFVNLLQEDVKEALLQNADQSLLEQTAKYEAARMQDMQAYIGGPEPTALLWPRCRQKRWSFTTNFGKNLCIWIFACLTPSGLFCAGPTPAWPSWPKCPRINLRITSSASATWITAS